MRSLDAELRTHAKAMVNDWDYKKLSFVLEAQGSLQDDELAKAQSRTNSALNNSLQAGFSLFTTNLENDQLAHRRWLLASSGDEAKARAAVVSSLEAHFFKGEKDCNVLRFQPYLNVCLQKIFDPDRKCIKLDGAWWIKPWLKYVPHGATHRRAVRPLETWVPCHDNNSDNRIIKFKMLSY